MAFPFMSRSSAPRRPRPFVRAALADGEPLRRALSLACVTALSGAMTAPPLAAASLGDAPLGLVLNGVDAGDSSGRSSGVGDVNGDGIADLLIRASGATIDGRFSAGEAYVVYGRPGGFPSEFELSSLAAGDGSEGFVIDGIDIFDFLGNEFAGTGDILGDVNGDGVDDIILGALGGDPGGQRDAGEAYVVFGRIGGFPPVFELSALSDGDGSQGFVLNGIDPDDRTGVAVGGAGDVNGDGINDILIGADRGDPNGVQDTGEAYVVFGRASGFPAQFPLASLAAGDGSEGFVMNGAGERDSFAYSLAGVGDINGDGIDDMCIGALSSPELLYVVFGRDGGGFPAQIDLGDLVTGDGTEGFVIRSTPNDGAGEAVNGAGDVNGDGIDDLIIGADNAAPGGISNAGGAIVLFGRTDGFPAVVDLDSLLTGGGVDGFILNGIAAGNDTGRHVDGAGDVNGDGIADVIISADNAEVGDKVNVGEAYVVFGRQSGFPAEIELSSLAAGDGSEGFVLVGIDEDDRAGSAVSDAGDINADGIDDLIVGSFNASPDGKLFAGETYVVYGTQDGFPPVFALSTLTPPVATTSFAGADARFAICRNITTGEAELIADPDPSPSTLVDCVDSGLAVASGDQLTIVVRAVSVSDTLTGGTEGLALDRVLCENESTGDSRLGETDPNGRWDCAVNGLPLSNGDLLTVRIATTVL